MFAGKILLSISQNILKEMAIYFAQIIWALVWVWKKITCLPSSSGSQYSWPSSGRLVIFGPRQQAIPGSSFPTQAYSHLCLGVTVYFLSWNERLGEKRARKSFQIPASCFMIWSRERFWDTVHQPLLTSFQLCLPWHLFSALWLLVTLLEPSHILRAQGGVQQGFPSPPERQPASPKSQKQTVKIGKRTGALFIYLSVCCMSTYAMVYVHVRSGDMHMCTHGCLPQLLFSSYLECSLIGKIGWLVRPRDPSLFAPWMLGLQVYVTTSGFLHGCRGSSLSSWGKHWLNQLCSCPRPLLLHVFAFNFPGEVDEWCTRRDPPATKWLCLS